MSKELVISSNRHETKVAILEDDQLVEIYFQRANEYSLAGSIHKGRVTRVLPGMQSAFVDLGLERDTFLYVSDFFEEHGEDIDTTPAGAEPKGNRPPAVRPPREESPAPPPVVAERLIPEAARVAVLPERASVTEETRPPEPREREQRDRGRRGRRRRGGRDRGFPESKYASPESVVEQTSASVDEPAEGVTEAPLILPGESLAKYSRSSGTENSTAELPVATEETQSVSEESSQPVEEPETPQLPEAPVPSAAAEEEPPVALETTPSPDDLPSNGDGSLTPSAEQPTLDEALPGALMVETAEDLEDLPAIVGDDPAEPEPAVATVEDMVAETEEDELPQAVQDEPETDTVAAFRPDESVMDDAAFEEPIDEVAPEQTATVRADQQGRYLQRSGRRMRRHRGRGGNIADREPKSADQTTAIPEPAPPPEPQKSAAPKTERERPPLPSITDLLKEGQEIIVQIAKEPLGQKGARITSHIALPGRYVVYMPTVEHTGVSRKIASDEERQRLKRILQTHRVGIPGGYIVRTAGEGKSEEEIAADMLFLFNLWLDIRQKSEKRPAPLLLHHDLDIVQRILRDQFTEQFKTVWVDNEEMYESVLRFVQRFQPNLVSRVKMYTRNTPIFDAFNISSELEKALRPKVWLKSGGYIVINQTEALVAIDVNTGKYVGKSNRLEDTIVKINSDAVKEIVRQIRLRDLGGIIVVDFIDMDERKNRQKVMQTLEEAMLQDRAPYKILQFNDFGLVAITRKRVKQSLERTLCSPCPYCDGSGSVKSVQTVIGEILQEALKIAKAVEGDNVLLRVHPEVAKLLKSHENRYLEEIEEILGRTVIVKSDPALHQEKFDLA